MAAREHKAELPTIVHHEIANALSDNIAFNASMEEGIAHAQDYIRRSVRQYATDNVIPRVLQETTAEVDKQSQALETSIKEQRKYVRIYIHVRILTA